MIKDTISILFDLKEIAKKRKLNHRENYRIYGNLIYSNKFKIFGFFWSHLTEEDRALSFGNQGVYRGVRC